MTSLHAASWPLLTLVLAALGATAAVAAARGRAPEVLERLRVGTLIVLVAQAAIGLALALRGGGPAEALHWVYGAAVIGILLVPGALAPQMATARRSAVLAGACAVGAVLVWRLWASA